MSKLFDIRHWGTAGRELSRESFILLAIQKKDFRVKDREYKLSHNMNEEMVVTHQREGNDECQQLCTTMSMLVDYLGKVYDDATFMTFEEIRDELITKSNVCDRVQLATLWSTVGHMNCQINLGYVPTTAEMDDYKAILNDFA